MYKQIIAKSCSAASNMCPQSEPWLTYYVTFTTVYIHHHATTTTTFAQEAAEAHRS